MQVSLTNAMDKQEVELSYLSSVIISDLVLIETMEPVVVINPYLRNAYWCLHILLNSALLNGHILCKQYQDSWPTKYGTLTGNNAYIEPEIFTVQFSQAVQCIAAKKQSFLCHTQDEERSGIQGSDSFTNNGSFQKQRKLTAKMFEKWDLKNFINSSFYFFPLKDNSNCLLLPYKTS